MLLGAAAEGAAPDVVPQLLDQLRVLLLDLLCKLLSPEKKRKHPSSPIVCKKFYVKMCYYPRPNYYLHNSLFSVWFLTAPVCLLSAQFSLA